MKNDNVQIILNMSVWESIEELEHYTFKTFQSHFLKRRREWFINYGKVSTALWWVEEVYTPTLEEGVANLAYLQENGPTKNVFDLRHQYAKPEL
jgi:hypothetical protein